LIEQKILLMFFVSHVGHQMFIYNYDASHKIDVDVVFLIQWKTSVLLFMTTEEYWNTCKYVNLIKISHKTFKTLN